MKITFNCPPELAAWLKTQAKRRHISMSAAVSEAARAGRDAAALDQSARAALEAAVAARAALDAMAEAYARGDSQKAADYSRRHLARARAALRRAGLELPAAEEEGEGGEG